MKKMSSDVNVECFACGGNITAKYFYRSSLGKYSAYCSKHLTVPIWLYPISKEDYLAHKAMEAL